jgi:acetylornithine deacetylase/succinyl-diaminopimelate desuccinylase-like protein
MARPMRHYMVTRIWYVDAHSPAEAMRLSKEMKHIDVYAQIVKERKVIE